LFVALGAHAEGPGGSARTGRESVIDGFWYGLAKRSFQFS
jgi:4,5-DOPA dioxygenase extradiol